MDEQAKQNLYQTFNDVIQSIIDDKRKDPKKLKDINLIYIHIHLVLH